MFFHDFSKTISFSAKNLTFFKNSSKKQADFVSENGENVWDYPEFRNAVLEAIPWDIFRKNASHEIH